MASKASRKKRRNGSDGHTEKVPLLCQRLRLIKKRHQELIVRPRNGLMHGLLGEEGLDEMDEAEEELQVLEGYGFPA